MKYYIAGAVLFAVFAVLAFLIADNNSQLVGWDHAAFATVNNPHGKILNQLMISLTKYGREVVWIATTALVFILGGKDGKKAAVLLVIAFIILVPLGTVLKDGIDRPRPTPATSEDLLVKSDNDASFPSGHAVIVSGGAFIMLARFNRGKQAIASLVLLAEAFLVIYSRIYVGDHYPLDVIGGILVGTGTSAIVVGFSKHLQPVFSRLDSLRKK